MKRTALAILAVAALSGCSPGPWAPSGPVPPSPAAVPSPSFSGEVFSGAENCAFYTGDGDYTVYVADQGVADCGQVAQALASTGKYWSPLAYAAVTQDRVNGKIGRASCRERV